VGKVIIFSAPSGAGKGTLIAHLLSLELDLSFSISATSRPPRGEERDGREYYFLTAEEFRRRAEAGEFVEWEEVYAGRYYGTLRSEVERLWSRGSTVLFDVDVLGGMNLKQAFGERALAVFVQPPSLEVLRQRLTDRGTERPEEIERRLERAAYELGFASRFDTVIVNDDLQRAREEVERVVRDFSREG
jgi:guanylate kinase